MSPAIGEAPFVVVRLARVYGRRHPPPCTGLKPPAARADSARMNRAGVLAAAGGAVAIGLAPVVPLLLAHDRGAFAVPDVHFYAVSATALVCAASPSRSACSACAATTAARPPIGAGFTVIAALLAVHGLTTPGFLIDSRVHRRGRRLGRARGAARRRRDPGDAALAAARARLRARPRLPADRRRRRRARVRRARAARPDDDPEHPRRAAPARLVDRRRQRADLRRARAARAAHVPAHAPPRRPRRRRPGLVWLAIAVATYLLSPVWSVGFWSGHVLELGAFLVDRGRARERSRARHPVARAALRDRRPRRRHRAGGAARRLGRAPARRGSPSRTPRRASTRAASRSSRSRSGRSSACAAGACAASPWPRCCTTSASCRCRTRSSRKAGPLTPAEFAVIKRHPARRRRAARAHRRLRERGRRSCAAITSGSTAAATPTACAATSSSLEVRILGVCDVYDALTSERVYRRAYTQPQALAILDQGRGSAFDAATCSTRSPASSAQRTRACALRAASRAA